MPLSFPNFLDLSHDTRVFNPDYTRSLPHRIFKFWNPGVSWDDHVRIFENLTPYCREVCTQVLDAVFTLIESNIQGEYKHKLPRAMNQEIEARSVWESANCGYLAVFFDSQTGLRNGAYMNPWLAGNVLGIHAEEALVRVAVNDLPMFVSEWRYFRILMDDMCRFMEPSLTRYIRWTKNQCRPQQPDEGVLVRKKISKHFDADGKFVRLSGAFVVASPEEYDRALEVNPEMVEPFCTTPGLVEPRYNAKAMLEKKDLKTVERMEVLMSTEEGRHNINAVAAEIQRRAKPLFEVAKNIRAAKAQAQAQALPIVEAQAQALPEHFMPASTLASTSTSSGVQSAPP
mmetsp:Transcript_24716/g.38828  ORF Transcript_24716/g.38828 Transcript_24716/m.38828 type:complete len:343 (+) Transcript_24716:155-1183(+)